MGTRLNNRTLTTTIRRGHETLAYIEEHAPELLRRAQHPGIRNDGYRTNSLGGGTTTRLDKDGHPILNNDPTGDAATSTTPTDIIDNCAHGLIKALDAAMANLDDALAHLQRTPTNPDNTSPKSQKCDNPVCTNEVIPGGPDALRPKDGKCRRCYDHQRRHTLEWPKKYSTPPNE